MELRAHEDTKRNSICKVKFHFFFDLLKKSNKIDVADTEFEWEISSDPQQRLYLSQDTYRMMEVMNNATATVYTRHNMDGNGKVYHAGEDFDEWIDFEDCG